MPPTPKETTDRINRRAAEAAKNREQPQVKFAKFDGITPGGLAIWRMPEGFEGAPGRTSVHKPVPKGYGEYPELWPNPAVDYPWKPAHSEGRGRRHFAGSQPNVHCDYVVILRTLEREFPQGIRDVASASNVLYDAIWPKRMTSIQLGHRIGELVDMKFLNEYKVSPEARRRKGITLRKEGFALLRSGIIPELPKRPMDEKPSKEEVAEALQNVDKILGPRPLELVGEEPGHGLAEEPQGEAVVGSLPPVAAPPAEPITLVPADVVEAAPDFYAIGVGVLEAYGKALERIDELERDSQNAPALRKQLEEYGRQLTKLRQELQATKDVANRYLNERNTARAEATTATRNLEAVMKAAKESPLSDLGQKALARVMESRPAPGPKSTN